MMTLRELLAGVAVREAEADLDLEISGVSYDSRKTRPGDLFVAMTGYATDGHKFIPMAREKGAACVLCQEKPEGEGPWVLVEDSRAALAQVGRNWYGDPAASMTMVGVTGTNGKTTTTYLLKDILEQAAGAKVGLIGTNQNMIGGEILPTERTTPESFELQGLLRRMADEGCTHVVMEVSSHALHLKRVAGIRFAVGIFTNLTQDHLDFHGTMEDYCDAKALLFRVCDVGVCNGDDPWAGRLMAGATCRQVFFGQGADRPLDLRAENVRLDEAGVSFDAVAAGEAVPVRVEIPGGFMVYNTLGVLAAARELGVPLADSARVLSHSAHVKGRVEPVPVPGDYTVLIDYAHTPNALENILLTAREFTAGRLICLFGCGGDRDRTKRPLMGAAVEELADLAVVTSDNPRTEAPMAIIRDILAGMTGGGAEVRVEPDRRAAIAWALDQGRPGDVIVLAGKGHETYQEINGVQVPLDEREVVAEFFRAAALRQKGTGKVPADVV